MMDNVSRWLVKRSYGSAPAERRYVPAGNPLILCYVKRSRGKVKLSSLAFVFIQWECSDIAAAAAAARNVSFFFLLP